MYSNNKQIRDVAAVAAQIMSGQTVTEKLHPNQQKIDVVDDEKIDAKDFAKLRAMKDKVKEEVEELEQAEAESLIENFEMISEVSLGAKIKAYASHSSDAFEHGDMGNDEESEHHSARAEKIHAHILKHHGTEAANHAEKAATSAIFGTGKHKGSDSLSGGLRGQHSKSVTKSGKIPKNTQSAMKNSAKGSYGKRIVGPKGHLPEEVEQIEEKKYEPEPPNAEAIARKKRLDAIRDRQEEKNRGNKSTSNVRKVEGNRYGGAKQKDEMDESVSFTSLLNTYKEGGLKPFLESLSKEEEEQLIDDLSKDVADETMTVIDAGEYTEVTIGEEADTAEFTKTLETNKLKASGKTKQPNLAKGDVIAVKNEEVEQVEERHMTDAEMTKRETIVKSMKKGLSGFKQRYGDKAKNVMYATATKQAMK